MRQFLLFLCLGLCSVSFCRPALAPDFRGMTQKREKFVREIYELAIAERVNHGVPAAITIAQAILESADGTSDQAVLTFNHFGVKAKTGNALYKRYAIGKRKWSEGNFCVYASRWWSFRHHSVLLTQGTYKGIREKYNLNYKAWAYQLKARGYAEDKNYPRKLIRLIEAHKLYHADGFYGPIKNPDAKL